jgi:hypothetical protein
MLELEDRARRFVPEPLDFHLALADDIGVFPF